MEQNNNIRLYTIGFTQKSARKFFNLLIINKVERIIDIRLNNVSQLSGFAKAGDLEYFLKTIAGINYVYEPKMAPTKDLLDEYKKFKGDWGIYEKNFNSIISNREIENLEIIKSINDSCLLCSEDRPDKCHRRLVAEYLQQKNNDVKVIHLY